MFPFSKKSRTIKKSNNQELADKLIVDEGDSSSRPASSIKRMYAAPKPQQPTMSGFPSMTLNQPPVIYGGAEGAGAAGMGSFNSTSTPISIGGGAYEQEMVQRPTSAQKFANRPKVREGYKWDFCLVLTNPDFDDGSGDPKPDPHPDKIGHEEIIERLKLAGLQTYCFYSGDGDEIFIKIRASLEILEHRAEKIGFRMLLDDDYIERYIDDPDERIEEDFDISKYRRYELIYAKFQIPGMLRFQLLILLS